jgi:hypothetical protein
MNMTHNTAIKLAAAGPCALGRDSVLDPGAANARAFGAVRRSDAEATRRARAICLDAADRPRTTGSAAPSAWRGENQDAGGDWPVGMGLVSVLLLAAGLMIGAAAAPVVSKAAATDRWPAQAAVIPVDADGYIDALSRLGLAYLPGSPTSPAQ